MKPPSFARTKSLTDWSAEQRCTIPSKPTKCSAVQCRYLPYQRLCIPTVVAQHANLPPHRSSWAAASSIPNKQTRKTSKRSFPLPCLVAPAGMLALPRPAPVCKWHHTVWALRIACQSAPKLAMANSQIPFLARRQKREKPQFRLAMLEEQSRYR